MHTSTTQNHLEIEDIIDNLLLLKNGSAAAVIQTNAINFGLLSEDEQDATIYAYAALLNSLTFPIQILIRSQSKDISNYLKLLEQQEIKQNHPLKKAWVSKYKDYVQNLITERNVLEKRFYLIIPFSSLELGTTASLSNSITGRQQPSLDKPFLIQKAKTSLNPKTEHVLRQLGRLGLAARQLNTQELIQLLFSIYNPNNTGQKLMDTQSYTTPLVQPAISNYQETAMTDFTPSPINTPTPSTPPTPTPVPPPSPVTPTPVPTPTPPTPPTPTPVPPPSPVTPAPQAVEPSLADAQSAINQAASSIASTPTPPSSPTM